MASPPLSIPFDSTIIDTTSAKTFSGTDRYIGSIIDQVLSPAQRVALSLSYRRMRQSFSQETDVAAINTFLAENAGDVSNKTLTVGVDTSARSTWEASLSERSPCRLDTAAAGCAMLSPDPPGVSSRTDD